MKYIIDLRSISSKECFADASKEELRVLLAILSENGNITDEATLASLSHTSKARAIASIAFWQEAGVLLEGEAKANDGNIREEYDSPDEPEESAVEVANEIKKRGLAALISECARLMDKPMLSTTETRAIVGVYTKYALGEEFIVTLAAFLKEKKKLTAQRLAADAERLVKKGVSCLEELEIYISRMSRISDADWEYKRFFSIFERPLSDDESERASRWFSEYGYSEEIVGLAYSLTTTSTGRLEISYMDSILKSWHAEGLKTLDECKAQSEKFREEKRINNQQKGDTPPTSRRKQKEKPRYGDFDVADAFSKALERSYGPDTEN